ncbi:hypothetical protein Bca4012_089003 [Brassica carinata]
MKLMMIMCFGDDKFKPTFSSSKTWSQTCTHHQSVNWSKIVWFAQKIPRFSFINCLTFKDRLSTANTNWIITVSTLLLQQFNGNDKCLLRLSFQAPIHNVWRERNTQKHKYEYHTGNHLVHFIDEVIRNRILALTHKNTPFYNRLMQR